MPMSEYPSHDRRLFVLVILTVLLASVATIASFVRDEWRVRLQRERNLGRCEAMMDVARTLRDSGEVLLRYPAGPSYSAQACLYYLNP